MVKRLRGRRRRDAALNPRRVDPVAWVTLDAALEARLVLVERREPTLWSARWVQLRGGDVDAWIDADGSVGVIHWWHLVADPPRAPAAWRALVADWSGDVVVPLPF